MTSDGYFRLLHGRDEPPAKVRLVHAGPVRASLDGVDLRYVRLGDTELVRRVYVAVRDRGWNTIPGELSDFEIEEHDDSFAVRFRQHHRSHDVDFAWEGTITGDSSGRIAYALSGRSGRAMQYNRIGVCVHHPWRETAGRPFRALTPDGPLDGAFPDLIGAQRVVDGALYALFPSFERLEVELDEGGSLLFEFDGDLWETEDHRNWTDANFKTYSTPLSLGVPHDLADGQELVQRIVVAPVDVPAAEAATGPHRLIVGAPTGTSVPAIGLGTDSDAHRRSEREQALVAALAPAHLRVELRLDDDGWGERLAAARESARSVGAGLEVSLHLRPEHAGALPSIAEALADGPPVARILVIIAGGRTGTPEETTPPELVDLVRAAMGHALAGTAFVGGTEMYFTEINRTRPLAATWDGICFSITPQVHAFTDIDVVENLDAQGENVRSAHALANGKPIVVSPITIRRRVNFHAAAPEPEPGPGELPDSVDVRQPSLYGGAWTAGSLKYICEAGVSSVTYYETTGWRGVLERESGTPLPALFSSDPGTVFPLYHPLGDLIEWGGADVLRCDSSDRLTVVGLAVRTVDGSTRMLVVNVTPHEQEVVVGPVAPALSLRRLNASSAEEAGRRPEAFRRSSERLEPAGGEALLQLAPYEVVRIDPS